MSKSIIVTGASGNLGKAVVRQLSEEGYFIEATIRKSALNSINKSNIHSEQVDLLDEQATRHYILKTIKKHKNISTAILLVGGFFPGEIADTDSLSLDKMISLNFKSAFNVVKPLLEQFKKQAGGGQFIFIGSRPAIEEKSGTEAVAYTLSKGLIFKLAELINAIGEHNRIRASVIVPGIINTATNRANNPDANFSNWVQPKEIASLISFVLSATGKQLREPILKIYDKPVISSIY